MRVLWHFVYCQGMFFYTALGTARIGIGRTGGIADADRNAPFEVRQIEVFAVAAIGRADGVVKLFVGRRRQRLTFALQPAFGNGASGPESDFTDHGAAVTGDF